MGQDIPLSLGDVNRNVDEAGLRNNMATCVNCYKDENDAIYRRPGTTLFKDLGEGSQPVDGMHYWDDQDKVVVVCNGKVFLLEEDGSLTDRTGDAPAADVRPIFAETADPRVVIATGGRIITMTSGGNSTYIADGDAPTSVSHVAWIDGYILALRDGTAIFQWSDANDVDTWNALNFATAEALPDKVLAMWTQWKEITLMGEKSTEVWWDDGTTPFSIYDGGYTPLGIAAKYSVGKMEGTWWWLERKGKFIKLEGRTPLVVSTPFDKYIQALTTKSDALGDSLEFDGRPFFLLTFPTDDVTLAFDYAMNKWFVWGEWSGTAYTRMRWNCSVYAKGWDKWLVGGTDGQIYEVSSSAYDDAGTAIRAQIRSGHIDHGTVQEKRSNNIQLRIIRGTQDSLTDVNNLTFRWRDDHGAWTSFQNFDTPADADAQYFARADRLGAYRMRQWEIVDDCTDGPFAIIAAQENVDAPRAAKRQ
jgi:hypothetical protein